MPDDDWITREATTHRPAAWPILDEAAFYGPLGEIVQEVAPETEADPNALLLSLLASFGSAVINPHVRISAINHRERLFVALVGDTATGAKGEAWGTVETIMGRADSAWLRDSVVGGFASGEAIIADLATSETGPARLVVESEFATVLSRANRDGSILSPILRSAWDGAPLENRRAQTAVVAREHHVSVVAQITPDELRRLLRKSEVANGFANRFLFGLVRRDRVLHFGGDLPPERIDALAARTADALEAARGLGRVSFADDARELWIEFVDQVLRRPPPGLIGELTARPRPQTLRLALLFAAADGSPEIQAEHIRAAAAIWQFSDASVRVIFETATGDPLADRLLLALIGVPDGLDMSEQRQRLGHNYPSNDLRAAGDLLVALGVAERDKRHGAGRPGEILRFTPPVKPAFTDGEL